MNNKLKYLFVALFAASITCSAQQAKTLKFKWSLQGAQKNNFAIFYNTSTSKSWYSGKKVIPVNDITYTLPKGAIFCRMEDVLYKHFNIWIKLRMGVDDKYSN